MNFFVNENEESKLLFEILDKNYELNPAHSIATLLSLEFLGIRDLRNVIDTKYHIDWVNEVLKIQFITFNYPKLRRENPQYEEASFNEHYYILLAFHLSRLLALQNLIDKVALESTKPEVVYALQSLNDLWSIKISHKNDAQAIRSLIYIYFSSIHSLGLGALPMFQEIEVFGYHLKNLESPEEGDRPLATLDTLKIFQAWYEKYNITPFSRQILPQEPRKALPSLLGPEEPEAPARREIESLYVEESSEIESIPEEIESIPEEIEEPIEKDFLAFLAQDFPVK